MNRLLSFAIAAVLLVPVVSAGQSLADVARAEEARRKNVKKAAKVYTNDDLKPDFTMPDGPPPPAAPDEPDEDAAPADEKPEGEAKAKPAAPPAAPAAQDEAAWRKRMADARADLQRTEMFAEALQSRINALTTDFVNRDDPAQRAAIERDREKALAELEKVRTDRQRQTKAITDIEDQARKAGVPAGWLR